MTGTFPSGGSTTIAARAGFIGLLCSAQSAGGFTPILTSSNAGLPSVSNGVLSKFTHMPLRSGWPSGVRPGTNALAVFAPGGDDCAAMCDEATATAAAAAQTQNTTRRFICLPLLNSLEEP